jgi:hypothetical protein
MYTLEEILEQAPERLRSAGASFEGKRTKRIKRVKNVAKKILKGILKVVKYAPGTENVQLYQGQGSQGSENTDLVPEQSSSQNIDTLSNSLSFTLCQNILYWMNIHQITIQLNTFTPRATCPLL